MTGGPEDKLPYRRPEDMRTQGNTLNLKDSGTEGQTTRGHEDTREHPKFEGLRDRRTDDQRTWGHKGTL